MFGNPIEQRTPRPVPSEFQFTNFVIPSNATEGVTPNTGFTSFEAHPHLATHPKYSVALHNVIDGWWDKKQPASPPDTFYLISNNNIKAIARKVSTPTPLLEVVVDRNHDKHTDPNWLFFEELIANNIALLEGQQERQMDVSWKYETAPFTKKLTSSKLSAEALNLLSTNWPGEEKLVYTITDPNGETTKREHGSFDLLSEDDKQLRLNITSIERILSQDGEEVARIVTDYVGQPTAQSTTDTIPLPVFSPPRMIVSGQTPELLETHTKMLGEQLSYVLGSCLETTTQPGNVRVFTASTKHVSETAIAVD